MRDFWIFNKKPLTVGAHLSPDWNDLPEISFKYADIDFVRRRTTDYVRHVLGLMPIKGSHSRILVDVKMHDMKRGNYPCLPGWHCDGYKDPRMSLDCAEVFHLYVAGHCRTEFITEPLRLSLPPGSCSREHHRHFANQMEGKDLSFAQVPDCTVVSYGRWDFHRGVAAQVDEKRLLVRVCETDIIRPRNAPFSPTQVGRQRA